MFLQAPLGWEIDSVTEKKARPRSIWKDNDSAWKSHDVQAAREGNGETKAEDQKGENES